MTTARSRAYRATARRWLAAFAVVSVIYPLLRLAWPHTDLLRAPLNAALAATGGGWLYWTGRRHENERATVETTAGKDTP